MTNEPKHELIVLSRKEVAVLVAIFALVGLLSFTVGLKLGKNIALKSTDHSAHDSHAVAEAGHDLHLEAKEEAHGHDEHAAAETEHKADAHGEAPAKSAHGADQSKKAEDNADTDLAAEITADKVGVDKPVSSSLPGGKRQSAAQAAASKFTLQVGSYKNTTEASDRVAELKRKGLEAFYFDAKVPGKGVWYRVGIGLFANKEAAEVAASKWKSEKSLPDFIVQKVSE